MNNKTLQNIRGTEDLHGIEYEKFRHIQNTAEELCSLYNYESVQTPIVEYTDLFKPLGASSDIVNKELYSFCDRSENHITLRPEFTLPITRFFLKNAHLFSLPAKIFSTGALFRYERPQKGRKRQFHQINFENIGGESPIHDIELILLAHDILKKLDILPKVDFQINSLGDQESRAKHRIALIEYFSTHKDNLTIESQNKIETNPLRIFDSKAEEDKKISALAPKISEFYNTESKERFEYIKETLSKLGIQCHLNNQLVRGLDYYSHTIFEFVEKDNQKSQNTVLGGGRYDKLISNITGNKTHLPSIGFAAGIERLSGMMQYTQIKKQYVTIIIDDEDDNNSSLVALQILHNIRNTNIITKLAYGKNIKKKISNNLDAKAIIIVNKILLENQCVIIKNIRLYKEDIVPIDKCEEFLLTNIFINENNNKIYK